MTLTPLCFIITCRGVFMYNNRFVKKYKSIPIAKYAYTHSPLPTAHLLTATELHKEFEMIYVKGGCARITVNHQLFEVKKGDLIFISPYSLHSVEIPAGESFSHICFCFDLNLLPDTKLSENLLDGIVYITNLIDSKSRYNNPLCNMFIDIDEAMTSSLPYWELCVQGNINLMFAYIMRNNLTSISTLHSESRDFCIKVSKYMKAHYKEKLTSSIIAADLNFHQGYFCRIFKKNFSVCFSDYLNMYRLEKAKSLLLKSELSVTDIAYEVGYESPSYFTKIFRIQNGVSPRKFRELNSIVNH